MIESGEVCSCRNLHEFIAIEVHEIDTLRAELGTEAALDHYEVCVSLMARRLSNNDTLRPELEECLCGSAHENRIRIDLYARDVFDKIRFQQYGFAAQLE